MKVKTWLPVFPGFYGTLYDMSDYDLDIDGLNDDRDTECKVPVDIDDAEWDHTDYEQEIVNDFIQLFLKKMSDYISDIEFERVVRPRFYNTKNDAVDIIVDLSEDNMKNIRSFIDDNLDRFKEYLKDIYKSRDGYISHYSYNSSSWLDDFKETMGDAHKCGAILEFVADVSLDVDDFCMQVLDSCYTRPVISNYYELLDKESEQVDQTMAFAAFYHAEDKYGDDPYFEAHTLKVYEEVRSMFRYNSDILLSVTPETRDDILCVALCHDLLEDHPRVIDSHKLEDEIGAYATKAVQILTRGKESYITYITNIIESKNLAALVVKLADLRCNIEASEGKTDSYSKVRLDKYRMAEYLIKKEL